MKTKVKADNELLVFEKLTGIVPSKGGGGDHIQQVRQFVGDLDMDAAQLSAKELSNYGGFSVFLLGGILKTINENNWFKDYGYQSFKVMVEEDAGLSRSTAYDYIKIYSCLTESGVLWNDIKHIGWTKIRWFAKHLTKANADEWINVAADKNVEELKKYIKQEVGNAAAMAELSTQVDSSAHDSSGEDAVEDKDARPPLVTEASSLDTEYIRQFKLYPEQETAVNQALEHAKAKLQTEHNGAALESICKAYLRDNVHGD
ncbi:MAG: hypothetical protein ABJ308_14890 [Halieaceae bacterium]